MVAEVLPRRPPAVPWRGPSAAIPEMPSRRTPVPWPGRLADWIDRALPELGGVRRVRLLAGDRLPFDWLPGRRRRYEGMTLWHRVYLRDRRLPLDAGDRRDVLLLLHELIHVLQFRRQPLLFPLLYLISLARHGYDRHPAEREARARAAELAKAYWAERA
jgi:hypothetical protein